MSIVTQIETANALGRQNLNAKGVETDGTETTYQIMSKIADVTGANSVEYSSITYNDDGTVTLTETNGTVRTMTCEYDGDKLVGLKYGNEVIPLTYEDDVLVGIGGMEVDVSNAPATSGTDTRLKELVEGTLTEIVDDTITEVGAYTFYYNKNFTKVELPNCTKVGNYAFQASNASTVIMPKLEIAGASAFSSCKVTEVNFPLLTSGNFSSCSELTRAIFDNIDNPNFKLCKKLVYCDLGTKITTISGEAFSNTVKLETLIIRNPSAVITISGNPFLYSGVRDIGYTYVPDDLVESYKVATGWSTQADRIKGLSELEVVNNE
jgi:hypothetical protein